MTLEGKYYPRVSLTIVSYRAERFIREAIDGAFSQDYPNLEIVLTDDCSADNTFAIMQEMAAAYTGPHTVVLNRNSTNLGLAEHVNKVFFDIATGDWVIVSAGDDVSLPGRISRVMEFANENVGAIHHKTIAIDDSGKEIGMLGLRKLNLELFNQEDYKVAIKYKLWLKGASACYNRKMLNLFGRINPDVTNEDKVYAYRALYFGKVIYLDEPLMKYRKHDYGVTNVPVKWNASNYSAYKEKIARWNVSLCKQILKDDKILQLDESLKRNIHSLLQKSEIILRIYSKEKRQSITIPAKLKSLYFKEKIKRSFLPAYLLFFNKSKSFAT
jgi:glycosyltransferase involved in cell wall biosynthesis